MKNQNQQNKGITQATIQNNFHPLYSAFWRVLSIFIVAAAFFSFSLNHALASTVYTSENGSTISDDGTITYNPADTALFTREYGEVSWGGGQGIPSNPNYQYLTYISYINYGSGEHFIQLRICDVTCTSGESGNGYVTLRVLSDSNNGASTPNAVEVEEETKIVSIDPENNHVFSTTTDSIPVTILSYIIPDDFDDYNEIRIFWDAVDGFQTRCSGFVIASSSGYTVLNGTISSSSPQCHFDNGKMDHSAVWTINTSIVGYYFLNVLQKTLDERFSYFSFSDVLPYNYYVHQNNVEYNNFVASTTVSFSSSSCNIFSGFEITKCSQYLLYPDSGAIASTFTSLKQGALSAFPLGYFTRFVEIMTTTGSTQPPPMEYRFGSSSPVILRNITENDPIYFQIFDHFDELYSIKSDDGEDKNIFDIIDPYISTVVSFAVMLYILWRLFGLEFYDDRTQDTSSTYSSQNVTTVSNDMGRTTKTIMSKSKGRSDNFRYRRGLRRDR